MSNGHWTKAAAFAVLLGGSAAAQTGQPQPQPGMQPPPQTGQQQPPMGQQQQPPMGQQQNAPGAMTGDVITATATVQAVDVADRSVTLQMPDGTDLSVNVPPDVPNLDRLQTGDKIDITYMDSVAVALQPPGSTPPQATVQQESGQLGGGQGRYTVERTTVTAKVVSVDQKKNKITFEGPQGKKQTVKVKDKAVQKQLGSLQPGQSVQVTYTEAVAMSLRPQAGG
jgi:hypothetical protein